MKIFSLCIFLYCNLIFSQTDYCKIKFKNLELLENGWKGLDFNFMINNKVIKPDKKTYYIKCSKKLDTIIFSFYKNFKKNRVSYTKFRKNETYIININPCSQYELFPQKKRKIGTIKTKTICRKSQMKVCFSSEEIPLKKNKKSRKFLKYHPSGMCPFSAQEIALKNRHDERIDFFYYHFLHGEKMVIKVSNDKLKFKIK